jgi:hypothetical protein
MTDYDIVRQACIKASPDIEIRTCACGERVAASMPGYHHCNGGARVWLANLAIDEREIQLVDVLLAMGAAGKGDWGITDKGAFFHSAEGRQQFYDEYWNLRINDLAKQPPDTLKFLADVVRV